MKNNFINRVILVHPDIPIWKRVTDIIFALTALIVLSPLFMLIALLIRLESKGKVIYSSRRVGTGYRIFNFYKFRSMYSDSEKGIDALTANNQYADEAKGQNDNEFGTADLAQSVLIGENVTIPEQMFLEQKLKKQDQAFFKMANDPRITRVGRLIRNGSLDELPQLFNILKGDMSVVGNRPLPLYEAELLTTDQWIRRFLAPAGLTGLWQVTKRGGANGMSADERKQLDIEYAMKYTFLGDLLIILKTFPALLQHENV